MSQQSARIVQEVHDEPHIEGSRITVRHIYERGLRPETVAERHNMDLANVCHALAYYHEHPGETREVKRQREKTIELVREKTTITPPDE